MSRYAAESVCRQRNTRSNACASASERRSWQTADGRSSDSARRFGVGRRSSARSGCGRRARRRRSANRSRKRTSPPAGSRGCPPQGPPHRTGFAASCGKSGRSARYTASALRRSNGVPPFTGCGFALYSAKKSGQDRRMGKTFLRILYKSLIKGFWVYAARAVAATACVCKPV